MSKAAAATNEFSLPSDESSATDGPPILACTVSRDVQNFEILIDEMEIKYGEGWGDLLLSEAADFLDQPDAEQLQVLAIALDIDDEPELDRIIELTKKAKELQISVLVIADELDPMVLHQVLQAGAREFLPYPMPENSLSEAIERIIQPVMPAVASPAAVVPPQGDAQEALPTRVGNDCTIFAVQGLAGGVGATTLAVNLAWELATLKGTEPRVALMDMDQQFGSVATYLDLPRKEAIYELMSDVESLDDDAFRTALQIAEGKLSVFTSPADILPLDLLPPEDIEKLITTAASMFDYIVIDMPSALVNWTETALRMADVFFPVIELDLRSAQNTLRFVKTLKAEDLPVEKLRFVLNRAPGFSDLTGKARVKRMAESLDISFGEKLPEGGKAVVESNDHGTPLAMRAAKNPLRKEIMKLAQSLHEISTGAAEAAK
ncbi:MAG: AAA family ATPase [Dinoroseobacter sp.]|nr:AAA family ATPase [Dinoroseobacter sp.]MDJ0993188.1 AAA family ATPase [Dinoroseobacter sp.]